MISAKSSRRRGEFAEERRINVEMPDAELAWIGARAAGLKPVNGVIRLSKCKIIVREDHVDGPPDFRIEEIL